MNIKFIYPFYTTCTVHSLLPLAHPYSTAPLILLDQLKAEAVGLPFNQVQLPRKLAEDEVPGGKERSGSSSSSSSLRLKAWRTLSIVTNKRTIVFVCFQGLLFLNSFMSAECFFMSCWSVHDPRVTAGRRQITRQSSGKPSPRKPLRIRKSENPSCSKNESRKLAHARVYRVAFFLLKENVLVTYTLDIDRYDLFGSQ